ncbi:MAG: hypothetical protein RIQ81_2105 [Pseudomonadota bacterium]
MAFFLAGATCPPPQTIKDVVDCRNALAGGGPVSLAAILEEYAPHAEVACTTSRGSAQPAAPEEGDFRCFQVFPGGLISSFNLVAGLNGDRIEIGQPAVAGNRDEVFLANVPTRTATNLEQALADATRPIEPGDRMTCGMCHRSAGTGSISGVDAWVFSGIRLNSSVRGTVPRNGQVAPELLDGKLNELLVFHKCTARSALRSLRWKADAGETCRRIAAVISSPGRFPLDNPPE